MKKTVLFLAMMIAAGDEEGHPDTGSVGYIIFLDGTEIHDPTSDTKNSMASKQYNNI